jgi:YfiH family protein
MLTRILPDWPAPNWVRAITTTREGGISQGSFASLNLAAHVKDNPISVAQNRLTLSQEYNFMYEPLWLHQTHSSSVVQVKTPHPNPLPQGERGHEGIKFAEHGIDADGAWTQLTGVPCVVLTGDCLPLLLCDSQGTLVAAIHCGWKGILGGIIEQSLKEIGLHAQGEILAWLGPAIGPQAFEVGNDVRDLFISQDLQASHAFKPIDKPGKWLADIYLLAKQRLQKVGVRSIYGGEYCTYTDQDRFYSYRRDGETGRMATLIWLALP